MHTEVGRKHKHIRRGRVQWHEEGRVGAMTERGRCEVCGEAGAGGCIVK